MESPPGGRGLESESQSESNGCGLVEEWTRRDRVMLGLGVARVNRVKARVRAILGVDRMSRLKLRVRISLRVHRVRMVRVRVSCGMDRVTRVRVSWCKVRVKVRIRVTFS